MGLSSALYAAVSGLNVNSQAMAVTGNNIANSNTTAYKRSSTIFSDLLAENVSSTSGGSQVGRGAQIQTVATTFTQGGFEDTGNSTDVAIDGDGFFIISSPENDINYYTRNGAFDFDSDGYLVNADGYRIQGSLYDEDGALTAGILSDIQVDMIAQTDAVETENITLQSNLDASSDELAAFDLADPLGTSNYSTTTVIYDSLGADHQLTCYYTKTADNTWTWNAVVDSTEIDDAAAEGDLTVVGTGTLTFDEDGNFVDVTNDVTDAGVLTWTNGAAQDQQVTYTFNATQFDSSSTVFSQDQDGAASGEVVDVNIDNDGTVYISYSNGKTEAIAMLALATFTNPNGLAQEGGTMFAATAASGPVTLGYPGESQGTLVTESLELSTVDLADEFVDLITIQNGYTANSRVITTTDEMLQELLNLKR